MENKQLTLPVSVISPIDVARLSREVENLDEFFRQSAIREGGTPQNVPRYSRLLDEVVLSNELNLLDQSNRELLIESFRKLQVSAPVMHISFSADPPGSYIQQIVGWLRQNIDGLILVRVGLMPNIGAGCVVRTTNKTFDFSLRKYFDSKHEYFMKRLHAVLVPEETETAAVDTVEVTSEEANQQIGGGVEIIEPASESVKTEISDQKVEPAETETKDSETTTEPPATPITIKVEESKETQEAETEKTEVRS